MSNKISNTAERSGDGKSESDRTIEQIASSPCTNLERGASGLVIAEISQPGHYCLAENFHARIEYADHAAEGRLISIIVGNVVLDLQGHTLGRGVIFKNPGGLGIEIVNAGQYNKGIAQARNIVIKNGVLQDFETGIYFGYGRPRFVDNPTFNPQTNTYHFPANNITLENITFKNNKKDFDIRIPDEQKK
ncbi:MAG: hypothetical protein ABFE02_08825 [Sulfuricella sp.]